MIHFVISRMNTKSIGKEHNTTKREQKNQWLKKNQLEVKKARFHRTWGYLLGLRFSIKDLGPPRSPAIRVDIKSICWGKQAFRNSCLLFSIHRCYDDMGSVPVIQNHFNKLAMISISHSRQSLLISWERMADMETFLGRPWQFSSWFSFLKR